MNNTCGSYALYEVVEQYCIHQFNDKRRYFEHYMVFAKAIWNDMLRTTLWAHIGVWLPVYKPGKEKYPYVVLPKNIELIFGLYDVDACGKLIPVLKTDVYDVLPKPSIKTCECRSASCTCGDNCSGVNSMTYTTKEVVIDGATYYEKEWIEACGNGELKKWREVPAKTEDGSVEVVAYSESVCQLETLPCGCIAETTENKNLIDLHCGCFSVCSTAGIYRPVTTGDCKTVAQMDGDKIYLIGSNVKEWYFLHYREKEAANNSMVPDFAVFALMAGIDRNSIVFNPRYSRSEKREAKYAYEDAKTEIVRLLNPIDMEKIFQIQQQPNKI